MTRLVLKPRRSSDSADVGPWGCVSLLFSQADDHLALLRTKSAVQTASDSTRNDPELSM